MKADRLRRTLHLALTAAGAVICVFFSIPAALVLTVVSLLILAVTELLRRRENKRLLSLCDDIDRILKGSEYRLSGTVNDSVAFEIGGTLRKRV